MAGFLHPSSTAADLLPPRAFDTSVYCLPFTLPSKHITHTLLQSELYPSSVLIESPAEELVVPWEITSIEERLVHGDGGDALADMGIAGGAGSGSSLSSRARFVPNSKYSDGNSSKPAAETSVSLPAPLLRTSSGDMRGTLKQQQLDTVSVKNDRAVLDSAPGWENVALTHLPDVTAGLPPHLCSDTIDECWWVNCEFTKQALSSDGGKLSLLSDDDGTSPSLCEDRKLGIAAQQMPPQPPQSILQLQDERVVAPPSVAKLADKGGSGVNRIHQGLSAAFGDDDDDDVEGVPGESVATAQTRRDAASWFAIQQLEEQLQAPETITGNIATQEALRGGVGTLSVDNKPRFVLERSDSQRSAMDPTIEQLDTDELPVPADDATAEEAEFDAVVNHLLSSPMPDSRLSASSAPTVPSIWDYRFAAKASAASGKARWAVTTRMTEEELEAAESTFKPVHTWPFPLDHFQREAIVRMEVEGPSSALFVSAHTSAGKTLVAEYAIALSMSHRSRVVYTSPIKALSNQKYHDLKMRFGGKDGKGVGIITGDVTINPDAPCLIMTTEILRSMLYRGDDLIADIEWVIFDEIHYINNEERGLAYEEVLLLLPDDIGLVFLSATSPNKEEFAEWVGRTKQKRVYVLGTTKRPVSLQHFLYSENHLYLLMDGAYIDINDKFSGWKDANYKLAAEKLAEKVARREHGGTSAPRGARAGEAGGGQRKDHKQIWSKFINLLVKQDLLPSIIFSFSRKLCEECAFYGLSAVDLTDQKEKASIHIFVEKSIRRLSGTDRTLPQIQRLRSLLRRGIGVHHAGLLPIMKECVELLFARGLVKVLFATETFAMGINMPARSVVYNGVKKRDGNQSRYLSAGEYTQMAGRAGRRGLDTRGTVILMCWGDKLPDLGSLNDMMLGSPNRLRSQFRLTYNMILNILRTDIPVTQMMARSFSEFASRGQMSGKDVADLMARALKRLRDLQQQARAIPCIRDEDQNISRDILDIEDIAVAPIEAFRNVPDISSFAAKANELQRSHMLLMKKVLTARPLTSVLVPGRMLVLEAAELPAVAEGKSKTMPSLIRTDSFLSSLSASDASTHKFWSLPAMVVSASSEPSSSTEVSSVKASGQPEAYHLTVLIMCPPEYTHVSAETELISAISSVVVKKTADDDDLDALVVRKPKGKGKPVAAIPETTTTADRSVHVGYCHNVTLEAAPHGDRRCILLRIPYKWIARITNVVIGDRTDAPVSKILDGKGSLNAMVSCAKEVWANLCTYKADVSHVDSALVAEVGTFTNMRAAFRLPPLNLKTGIKPQEARYELIEWAEDIEAAEKQLSKSKCNGCPQFDRQWVMQARIKSLQTRIGFVHAKYSIEALSLYPEMQCRFEVLRLLRYTKPGGETSAEDGATAGFDLPQTSMLDVVALKGRVAAEVNTCDELIFTEMLFEGVLNPLSAAECAALLSCLVFQDRGSQRSPPPFPPIEGADGSVKSVVAFMAAPEIASAAATDELDDEGGEEESKSAVETPTSEVAPLDGEEPGKAVLEEADEVLYSGPTVEAIPQVLFAAYEKLVEIAVAVGAIQKDAGIPDIIPEEYARQKLHYGLLLPTYAWARGVPFAQICGLTSVQEGIIVRTITRLDETCREVRNSARIMGDPLLFRKMEAASAAIKRDVIFAGSLYL